MRELVEYVARQLVTEPDAVSLTEAEREGETVLELRVAKVDLGRVIGKEGRTAKALRAILNAAAARKNRRVVLDIIEDVD
ncbi:MAG: KH domain-containing protein [Candidatus Binatia bacterium]